MNRLCPGKELLSHPDPGEGETWEVPSSKAYWLYLNRTHPVVETLASYVLDTALDALGNGVARRCGVTRTRQVTTRTTVLLLRYRFHIITTLGSEEVPLLAEDSQVVAFEGKPTEPVWLSPDKAEALLNPEPDGNVLPEMAVQSLQRGVAGFESLKPCLVEMTRKRGQELLEAHERVRAASKRKERYRVEAPQDGKGGLLPPDVLGMYVFLPAGNL